MRLLGSVTTVYLLGGGGLAHQQDFAHCATMYLLVLALVVMVGTSVKFPW